MRSVLSGIGYLHQYGFIHRDLDPSNVMLTQEGFTKVIDFGICKRIGISSYGGGGLTQAGQFLGKVAYAAPELILGDLKTQGPATDIYALGIMLYQMLMGALPVSGSDQEVMDAHLKGKLDFSGIQNKKLRKILEKATNTDPYKRYASASEFSADLSTIDITGRDTRKQTAFTRVEKVEKPVPVRSEPRPVPSFLIPLGCISGLVTGILIALIV
jgi:serine/threonine protein kinase